MAQGAPLTAWQNIAEDFAWVGPFLDTAGPLIGMLTALVIAFVAYPWQKNRDRSYALREEKRASYQRFLRAVTEHQLRLANSFKHRHDYGIGDSTAKAMAVSYELVVYAPPSVIDTCETYLSALFELEDHVMAVLNGTAEPGDYGAVYMPSRVARRDAVLAIRADIADETFEASERAVAAFFGETLESYEDMQKAALDKLMGPEGDR